VEASGDGRRLLAEGSSEVRRPVAPGQHEGGGALGGSCVAAIGSVGWDSDGEEEDGRVFFFHKIVRPRWEDLDAKKLLHL
jgi:hypothetical protein